MSTRSALIFAQINSYYSSLLSLISAVVLARILTPAELGLVAIASSSVIIADILKNAGLSSVLIREQTLNKEDLNKALGVSVIVSYSLGLIVAAVAIPVSIFYQQDDLRYLLLLMSIPFFITPFYANCFSIYSRKLKYHISFKISSITLTGSLSFTIFLVLNGFSYYSIPLGSIFQACLFLLLVTQNIEPEFTFKPAFRNVGYFFKSGMSFVIVNVLNRYLISINDLILGKLGSLANVAIYSRGIGLADYVTTTLSMGINSFALPYLSRSKRETDSLEVDYYLASQLSVLVNLAGLFFAAIFAEELVLMMFGSQWVSSIPIAEYFCLFMAARAVVPFFNHVLVIEKQEKILIAFLCCVFIAICINLFLAFPMGLEQIALNMSIIGCVMIAVQLVILQRVNNFSARKYLIQLSSTFCIVLLATGCAWLCKNYIFDAYNLVTRLFLSAACVGVVLLFCCYWVNHPIYNKLIKSFIDGRKKLPQD